jgi:hypothetical protein
VANDATVPIIPAGSNVPTLLPPALLAANLFVKEVHVDVSEAVPDVLAAGGVVSDEFRLFISYRWQEAAAVADQLFDALSHVNFDVFLDRFRQAPGNNFALRINEALADMAFVLVLETPLIAQSPWVGLEVAYARNNRLGLLALQLPRGVALPQIRQSERKSLRANDLVAGGALVPQACADLVQWVRVEHGRALAERQRYVRNNMRDAILDRNGIVIAGRSGLLHTAGGVGGVATYGVRVTARTPALGDFHDCDGAALLGEKRVIVGPIVQLRQLRASRLQWLRRRTGVELFDEADMVDVAEDMVGGVL